MKSGTKTCWAYAFLVVSALVVFTVSSAWAAAPTFFAPFSGPIGVAAAPGSLYVTRGCVGTPVEVHSIDSAGSDTLIATIPNSSGTCEGYIAISPGLGSFTANDIYVTNGSEIWRVTPTGSSVTLFATLPPPLVFTHTGITFDHIGTFGNQMIVTTFDGRVFTIDSNANVVFVAQVPGALEGPDVAPLTFGPLGGNVFAADEATHQIWAVSPTGAVTSVAGFFAAESVHFIPNNVCSFGTSGGAFFSAIFPSAIYKFAPTDFTGLGGSMIVTSEGGGSSLLQFNTNTGYTLSPFGDNVGQHEGSAFVDCAVPPVNIQGRMTGGGSIGNTGVRHGFELNCDATKGPNHLEINWGKGKKFHLETLTSATCSDNLAISPNPPSAPFDTYKGKGTGRYNGVSGATAEWTFDDKGEPGKNDYATIKITDAGNNTVLNVSGNLSSGNHQAHAP